MSKTIAIRNDIYDYLNNIRNKSQKEPDGEKISFSEAFDKVRRHEKV
jgi:predicted CopG family antitoxin